MTNLNHTPAYLKLAFKCARMMSKTATDEQIITDLVTSLSVRKGSEYKSELKSYITKLVN